MSIMSDGLLEVAPASVPSINVSFNLAPKFDAGYQDLERLRKQSQIPVLPGTSGEVINALQERIVSNRNLSLDIEAIAQCIDLSKRTLQRRLKDQNTTYIELRDKVRFHYSVNCLLYSSMGVEEAAKYLDFADRTSFTNAFKRWASVSPNTFKKLYRDYV